MAYWNSGNIHLYNNPTYEVSVINSFDNSITSMPRSHNCTAQMSSSQETANNFAFNSCENNCVTNSLQPNNHYLLNEENNTSEGGLVLKSNLTPDAKEFKPSCSYNQRNDNGVQLPSNSGAIKKVYNKSYNGRNTKYSSGKSNSSRNTYQHDERRCEINNDDGRRRYRNYYNTGFRRSEERMTVENTAGMISDLNKKKFMYQEEYDNTKRYTEKQKQTENVKQNTYESKADNKRYDRNGSSEYYSRSYRNKNYKAATNDFGKGYRNYKNYNGNKNIVSNDENNEHTVHQNDQNASFKPPQRNKDHASVSRVNNKSGHRSTLRDKLDRVSQRERLEEMIVHGLLECLVCYEKLRNRDKVWSCKQCYHILHLQCVKQWAQSSKLDSGWRCPACQNICMEIPELYLCYCGKMTEPQFKAGNIPHSCNEICSRKGRTCSHKCTLICHPGPCPDCNVMVSRTCNCGSTTAIIKCGSRTSFTCDKVCKKNLNCGIHKCTKTCHEGDCSACTEKIIQECYCFKQGRKVACTAEINKETQYSCGDKCEKLLACGNHKCTDVCHKGECKPCPKSPDQISTCPCGQMKLKDVRKSCMDPIPCCGKVCNKILSCGPTGSYHRCKKLCHEGNCPPCPLVTPVKCRCGNMDKEIPCMELTTRADDARCQKKCTKKRSCGKHRCNQLCCIEFEHVCPLPCNRTLSCGNHRCEQSCHKGRCPPCLQSSFEELYCECGSSVIFPPVPCGTKPPPCNQTCTRPRPCGHEPFHLCHPGPCPPCTVLTKTWCYGKHEQRSTIPCHQGNFSCGLPCGRPMPCGRHKCNKACHEGECPQPCKQPCNEIRSGCDHPCNQPCHKPPCPDTPCRQMVKVTCQCGLRSASKVCLDLANEHHNIIMSQLATKIEEIQRGESVDLSDIVNGQKKSGTLKVLECTEECRVVERNRRLAAALQVSSSDYSQKIVPKYSDYMRAWAKKNPAFCQYIHDKLTELVQLAKQSKQKSRSYSFETMNKEKRHFVHEYCEHFGCESVAYDPEPNRNVVATAFKDKSYFPSYSLLEIIQRENGQRKVPGPQQLEKSHASTSDAVSLKVSGRMQRPPTPPAEYVDYFDNPPI